MTNFRERVNAHLPVLLQLLSTASLVLIALSALCGSNSLKKMAEHHTGSPLTDQIHLDQTSHSN
ncbi:hypothetical protein [Prochlorococcus marinus]|uniref:Uncharacterized protein n=1 Tax=Prochlorococcus marinus (strain MIT 9211) TaxID=93059 RepID=A9B9S9_PROM4|nr:hypothetical protein [Prochlorococcus marinus]ABX08591.1 Hypothetical protein P9211_06601 [Prochlorococcus marinus str. MIT 9211]